MLDLMRVILGVLLLTPSACDSLAARLAGIDTGNYVWEPVPGTKHENTSDKDLGDCEAPGGPAAGADKGAASGVPTIARSPNSPVVIACMVDKWY